jgi:hypothetical protein
LGNYLDKFDKIVDMKDFDEMRKLQEDEKAKRLLLD